MLKKITCDEAKKLNKVTVITSDGKYYSGKLVECGYSPHDCETWYRLMDDKHNELICFGLWGEYNKDIAVFKETE